MKYIWEFIVNYIFCNFLFGIIMFAGFMLNINIFLSLIVAGGCIWARYRLDKKLSDEVYYVNLFSVLAIALVFTISFYFAEGYIMNKSMGFILGLLAPFFPLIFLLVITEKFLYLVISIGFILLCQLILSSYFLKKFSMRKTIIFTVGLISFFMINFNFYINSPQVKYKPHSFEYMHGYSSTDFSDYMVYSENSKLATLNHESGIVINNEKDMPVLDGAEACFPLYSSIAKAIYKDIDIIENKYADEYFYQNGKIVTFTNSQNGYYRLIDGEVDIFFGAKPSQEQLFYAEEQGKEIELIEIGKEAFVFFVDSNNPITDLTKENIQAIYHGDVTNWNEVGGKNEKILAFQRPENSGSQVMMNYFMNGISLKKAIGYELVGSMGEIIDIVAEYNGEKGAIGYTFRHFLTGLHKENNVKMISVDGVYPSSENIRNGIYPVTAGLYCAILKDNNKADKVIEFILSDDGQELVENSGYIPIK